MNEPKIAERVKFWQEQDRINRELIPRVIKSHKLLTRHVESHEDGDSLARTQIEALEAQVAELETRWANRVSRWLPYAALALAVVALVLALVR
jgi:phage shock protein A